MRWHIRPEVGRGCAFFGLRYFFVRKIKKVLTYYD